MLVLKTSNRFKIEDYKLIGLPNLKIEKGTDIKEVQGTIEEVILYKTLEASENEVIEDSTLRINNIEYINMKYDIENINNKHLNEEVELVISIGLNLRDTIKIYQSAVKGFLHNVKDIDVKIGYDINKHFIPSGYKVPLCEIKDFIKLTPRYKALMDLKNEKELKIISKKDIKKWTGEYQ